MDKPMRMVAALSLIALIGGCAAGEEAEMPEEVVEAPTMVDISTWDADGDGLITAGEEWTKYVTDRLPWHVWDADQSGALEQAEFEAGAVFGRAAEIPFETWDADGSGAVEGGEWEAVWMGLYDANEDGALSAEELSATI